MRYIAATLLLSLSKEGELPTLEEIKTFFITQEIPFEEARIEEVLEALESHGGVQNCMNAGLSRIETYENPPPPPCRGER